METTLTNSLFRFVTFRGPEAAVLTTKNPGYAQYPNSSSGSIYNAVKNGQTLAAAAAVYGNKAFTAEDVVKLNPELAEFGQYLVKNAESITHAGIQQMSKPEALTTGQRAVLWDNLLYQMATQKSLYAKDSIIEMIIADNFFINWNPEDATANDLQQLAKTRVVVPSFLFGEPDTATHVPAAGETTFKGSVKQREALSLLIAKDTLDRYTHTVEELKKAQQAYSRSEQERHQAILNDYNKKVALFIKSKQQGWVPDPEKPEALPYDQYDLPQLSYDPTVEMTDTQLAVLSPESRHIIAALGLQPLASYDKALDLLAQHQEGETKAIFGKSTFSDAVVFAGGAAIPVADHLPLTEQEQGYSLQLFKVTDTKYKIGLVINARDKSPQIISSSFSLNSGPEVHNDQISAAPVGDQLGLIFYADEGFELPAGAQAQTLSLAAELQLNNGRTLTLDKAFPFDPNTGTTVFTGMWDEPQVTLYTPYTQPAPSTHGFKKLGIADYRRVEQTICCYVPGEVSHIENVMAKEYKERSTRNLRRTEDTITTESQAERESQTDTTTAERYEMQQEAASILNETKSAALAAGVNTNFSGTGYAVNANVNGSYASNISKQLSLRQATDFAKEITMRASERVVQKVREERISRIIEEYEERNTHGFDNRGDGAENISGVYRWVDKVYKNQIINYGVRTMYEFMIPQPAMFHKQAMSSLPVEAVLLEKPLDPRTTAYAIKTPGDITRANYLQWMALYGASVEAPPAERMSLSRVLAGSNIGNSGSPTELISEKENVKLPEGYATTGASVTVTGISDQTNERHCISASVGYQVVEYYSPAAAVGNVRAQPMSAVPLVGFENELSIGLYATNFHAVNANFNIDLKVTSAFFEQWQVETFNAIMKAYNEKLEEYNKAYAAAKANVQQVKEANPLFYRRIENTILKKNCIAYLVGQSYMGGQPLTTGAGANVSAQLTTSVDSYASVASFMEQAFEWEIMSYSFYPFYWGEKAGWNDKYTYENDDPLFRAFMQSGMARVIATVRPGFEDAVLYYLTTGQVWLGGHVPVIGDPLYTSILDTLAAFKETPEGAPWETKVPTSLTVIQNSTTGLDAEGLPCADDCSDAQYFFSSDNKLTRLKKDEE